MIDIHAVILHKLDKRNGLMPEGYDGSFETQLLYAMSKELTGETFYEELERRYPNWRDEFQ